MLFYISKKLYAVAIRELNVQEGDICTMGRKKSQRIGIADGMRHFADTLLAQQQDTHPVSYDQRIVYDQYRFTIVGHSFTENQR